MNPNTGKSSGVVSEFSAQNWNARTLRHLKDIHVLGEERFNQLFDMVSNSKRGRGRTAANPEPSSNLNNDDLLSDDTLQSEPEDNNEGGDEETARDENIISIQDHEDHSESVSNVQIY